MLNAIKNITTPIIKVVLSLVSPIIKKEPINKTIDSKNICFGLLYFSPKTAAGPIATRPKIIAGK